MLNKLSKVTPKTPSFIKTDKMQTRIVIPVVTVLHLNLENAGFKTNDALKSFETSHVIQIVIYPSDAENTKNIEGIILFKY